MNSPLASVGLNSFSSLKKFIWVTFQRKGYHRYPDAPAEVDYLQSRHRHLFKFKVKLEVRHDNREIEFHMFQNQIEAWYDTGALELDYKSCEMMADDLAAKLHATYGAHLFNTDDTRSLVIEVSEDGECGAEAYYQI